MIIVQVFHSFWPILGGVERAMQRLSEELAKLGHEVHIVTSTYRTGNRPRYETINGMHVHRVKAWTLHFPDLTLVREIPREVLKRADVVHCWSQNSYFTYKICKEAKNLGKPIVMYFLGVDYLKHHYNILIRLFGYLYQKYITRKVVKITNLALVTNEYEKKLLKERYGVNAIVLPHGVDDRYLKLPNMAQYFKEKYGIEGRIIAYIGRIHPTKGIDLLIKAFAEVVKQVPDAILVIAGKGDKKYLMKYLRLAEKLGIHEKVKYIGYISEKDKIALIDASRVVVLPTKHAGESYPLLIDEVRSRGKLVLVLSRSPALQVFNYILRVDSVKELSDKLVDVLFTTMKPRLHINLLTWAQCADMLLKLYRESLNS